MHFSRFWMIAPLALGGCQLLIGLDEGTLTVPGAGGGMTTSVSVSAASGPTGGGAPSSSAGTGNGGATAPSASSSSTGGGQVLDLIDDMEAGTGQILTVHGRVGSWFSYDDMSGMQLPAPGGACLPELFGGGGAPGSTRAMHTTGTQFTSWGAGIGFDLNHPGAAPRQPYDASQFAGIVFWARSLHPLPVPPLQVRILEPATVPLSEGGTCEAPDGGLACGDSHSTSVVLTGEWKLYQLDFSSFKQVGWGVKVQPPELDPSALLAVQLAVESTPDFDYWIDDVSFYQ